MKKISPYLLALFFNLTVYGQFTESWNIEVDNYGEQQATHTNKHPPIDIRYLPNGNMAILSQDANFLMTDKFGTTLWKKKIGGNKQRIELDDSENVLLSTESILTKFDPAGNIIWQRDYSSYFKKKYPVITCLFVDSEDNIYVSGYFYYTRQILQAKINAQGELLWRKTFKQESYDWYEFLSPKEIIMYNSEIYLLCYELFSKTILYKTDSNGKRRDDFQFNTNITSLEIFEDKLFAFGLAFNKSSSLRMLNISNIYAIETVFEYNLPKNAMFKKENYYVDPDTKKLRTFYTEYLGTHYSVEGISFKADGSIFICGHSNKRLWIIHIDKYGKLILNWDGLEEKYISSEINPKKETFQTNFFQRLSHIRYKNNHLIVAGISEEEYPHHSNDINVFTFVKKLEVNF